MLVLNDVLPCIIRYQSGHLWFIGYIENKSKTFAIELEQIYSFEILREQTAIERKKIETYINNSFSILYNNLTEIILECTGDDYEALYAEFGNGEVLCQRDDLLKIKLNVNEDSFIRWYLTHWPETVTISEPQRIKERLVSQAQIILQKYNTGGRGQW